MCVRFKLVSILISVSLFYVSVRAAKVKFKYGPGGMSFNDSTSCEQFAKYARFNPYSVLYAKWFVFFYWSAPISHETYIFTFPTANHTKYLHKILDGNTKIPVNWTARQILMENHLNETSLLVERGDRGQYWDFPLLTVTKGRKINPRDLRIKQVGDNHILGIMDCDDGTVIAMSKINEVPPKNRLQEEAARLGFRGRQGKSYLYQGHEWMPIPDDDEENYWQRDKVTKYSEKSSNEVESSERSSKEVDTQPTNVAGKSQIVNEAIELHLNKAKSTDVPGNSQLTKAQLDTQKSNVIEAVKSTDEPESKLEELEHTQVTNYREKQKTTKEPEKIHTIKEPNSLQTDSKKEQEELLSTNEPNSSQCNDCNISFNTQSTDEPYLPVSIMSNNNLDTHL